MQEYNVFESDNFLTTAKKLRNPILEEQERMEEEYAITSKREKEFEVYNVFNP